MKAVRKVFLMLVAAITGLHAASGVGCGALGCTMHTKPRLFVGEGFFYAGALLCLSLTILATDLAAGVISYGFWSRRDQHPV